MRDEVPGHVAPVRDRFGFEMHVHKVIANRHVDQLHDGMGFLTQHVALSNAFEKALQAEEASPPPQGVERAATPPAAKSKGNAPAPTSAPAPAAALLPARRRPLSVQELMGIVVVGVHVDVRAACRCPDRGGPLGSRRRGNAASTLVN